MSQPQAPKTVGTNQLVHEIVKMRAQIQKLSPLLETVQARDDRAQPTPVEILVQTHEAILSAIGRLQESVDQVHARLEAKGL